jgi:hypothetical protein
MASPDVHRMGTDSGYRYDLRHKILAHRSCLHAHAVYCAEQRNKNRCAPGLGWPLVPGPDAGAVPWR